MSIDGNNTCATDFLGSVAKYITRPERIYPCQMKEISFKIKKKFLILCLYISCRFKFGFLFNQKNTKKKRVFFYIFSFAYWFSRLFDNLHCVTQVCEVSILFSFSVSKKIVHFFCCFKFLIRSKFNLFDWAKLDVCFLDLKTNVKHKTRNIFCVIQK